MSSRNSSGRGDMGYARLTLIAIVCSLVLGLAARAAIDYRNKKAASEAEQIIETESMSGTVEEAQFCGRGRAISTGGDFDGRGLRATDARPTLVFTLRADHDQKLWSVACESDPFSVGYGDLEALGLQLQKGARIRLPIREPWGRHEDLFVNRRASRYPAKLVVVE